MEEELNTKYQEIAMTIIAYSGEAKGLAFEALRVARDTKDIEKAKKLLAEANESIHKAHQKQTDLLTETARGIDIPVDVLLIHSQDHLMTTMIATELITEMIEMYK